MQKLRLLSDRGRYAEAEALLKEEIAKDPDNGWLFVHLVQVLLSQDRPKEAESAARRAIGLMPDEGLGHEMLAHALMDLSRWNEAEAAVGEAVILDGDDADRRAIRARIALDRNKHQECLDHSQAGLAIDPDHEGCRQFRSIALGRLGRHDEADEDSLDLLRDDPDAAHSHVVRGFILLERRAIPEAKGHFREALRLDPTLDSARSGLVQAIQMGNPVLGWLLRAVVALARLPIWKVVVVVLGANWILPRLVAGPEVPDWMKIVVRTMSVGIQCFFLTAIAVRPLFDALVFFDRDGRQALDRWTRRAVFWSLPFLLVGIVLLGLWLSNGARAVPAEAGAFIATAVWAHAAAGTSHSWIRRRLGAIAGTSALVAVWCLIGQISVVFPAVRELLELLNQAKQTGQAIDPEHLATKMKEVTTLRWRFIVLPSTALILSSCFINEISEFFERRVPADDPG